MSTQSGHAVGRKRDLRGQLLDALRDHAPLTDRLAQADGVDDGASVIMPAPLLDARHRDSGAGVPGAAVGVAAVTASSDRENRQERKNLTLETDLQLRERTLKRRGLAWADAVDDELAAVALTDREGWNPLGATGGTVDPLFDESINRYRSTQDFRIEHWG